MKIHQELYGFYFLFILLGIALAGLATALFLYKSQKLKSRSQQVNYDTDFIVVDDDVVEVVEEEVRPPISDLKIENIMMKPEPSNIIFKPIEVDDVTKPPLQVEERVNEGNIKFEGPIIREPEVREFESIIVEPLIRGEPVIQEQESTITIQDSIVPKIGTEEKEIETPMEKKQPDIIEIKPMVQKVTVENVRQREFQERYRIIRERLADQDKYAMAHKELLNRVNSIKKELVLFRQVINSESNEKIVNQVAKIINKSLTEVEKDVKAVPVLVELSQNIIPRMITQKLNEYEKIKNSGVNVDKTLLLDLRGMATELVEVLSKIKKIELDGLLEKLMEIAKKLDKMSIKENMR